jgi:hypothetical protein
VGRGECEKRRVRTGRCEAESRSERGDGEWEKGRRGKSEGRGKETEGKIEGEVERGERKVRE